MKRHTRLFAYAFAIVLTAGAAALAPQGPSFDLSWQTVDSGGGTSTGGGFELDGAIGHPDAGVMSGGTFTLSGGFWVFGAVAEPCPWDCGDNDGNVGIVDFLALLAQWDQVGSSCDFDGGGVGIVDFLKLLANWGPCPWRRPSDRLTADANDAGPAAPSNAVAHGVDHAMSGVCRCRIDVLRPASA